VHYCQICVGLNASRQGRSVDFIEMFSQATGGANEILIRVVDPGVYSLTECSCVPIACVGHGRKPRDASDLRRHTLLSDTEQFILCTVDTHRVEVVVGTAICKSVVAIV